VSQGQLELSTLKHKQEVEDEVHRRQLQREAARHRQKMDFMQSEEGQQVKKMDQMRALGVDLTKVLVAEQRVPDKHLRNGSRLI
jgi:hypothetical protein